MSNIIKDGAALLAALLKEHASEIVKYERPELGVVDVPATFGSKLLRTHDAIGGVRLEWTDLDFIIPAADLVIAGQQITPVKNDFIYTTQGLESPIYQRYEVLPFGFEPPWRWSDPFLINYRIHTKFVAYAKPVQETGTVFFGASTQEWLDSPGIQSLVGSRSVSTPVGIYNFSELGTSYKYICYPDSMGDIDILIDLGANEVVVVADSTDNPTYAQSTQSGQSYALVLVSFNNDPFNAVNYRSYRTKYLSAGGLTIQVR